ncbi:isoprenyl transferase [Rhizobiales bacterium]|uniref:isoprenyl transferase n=1 Tax=Hongsoonwoonella zoysiae TaxID=2821844 RepID=UPI0015612A07|nr:isoprenyl transferase [Hongsoonwoonella zoysiae]NRG18698.1 isoprenyl transferase [Hongsoonwoonella zoysiae]
MTATAQRNAFTNACPDEKAVFPRHVAIIMDGNGRWARERNLPRTEGHRKGVETLRKIVRHAAKRGIGFLTLYSFSSENWTRPEAEVSFLMGLLQRFVQRDLAELDRNNIKVRIIGERDGLSPEILSLLDEAETVTCDNSGMVLTVAFNYGARNELTRAVKSIVEAVVRGEISSEQVDEAMIASRLDTVALPDPDLIIRTSGEQRLSNFLLWQAAYAEFFFPSLNWPDFNEEAFDDALAVFAGRERRYGGLSGQAGG